MTYILTKWYDFATRCSTSSDVLCDDRLLPILVK